MNRTIVKCLAAAALVSVLGCDKKDDSSGGPSASASGSARAATSGSAPAASASAPAASASAAAPPPAPAWFAQLPTKPVTAKVGDLVWGMHAFALNGQGVLLHPLELTALSGNTGTLRDLALMASGPDSWKLKPNKDGSTYAGVPGSVILPLRSADVVKPKVGDIVWAGVTNAPGPFLVKVTKVDGGLVQYDKLNATSKELLRDQKVQNIEPYGTGIAPFTYVAIKTGDAYKLLLVLGTDGDNVYGMTYDGVLVAKKADVKPLKAVWKDRKKGDSVLAFNMGGEGKVVKIETVPMEKWVFKVGVYTYTWDQTFDAP